MKLELAILAGDESKKFLAQLGKEVDRLEKIVKGIGENFIKAINEDEDEDDEFVAPAKKSKKAAAAAFDEEDEDSEDEDVDTGSTSDDDEDDEQETTKVLDPDDDDEDEEEKAVAPPAKRGRPKKITIDTVNDACKAKAASIGGKEGRNLVLGILKKKFKTESVTGLKPEQYSACIEAMTVEQ